MPRGPKKNEPQDEYISFCIKYMIDNKEYPNTEQGRKQAAGHCYSLWRRSKQPKSSVKYKKATAS